MIKEVSYLGMTSSIITNGTTSTSYYEKMRLAGLNHLHVSVHGLDDTFDRIVGVEGAGKKQRALFEYLNASKWPWRMNMTIQQENYKQMADIAKTCLDNGCRHIIPLNFLPHYEWNDPAKLRTVAVHPKDIFPELIKVYDAVEGHNNQDSSPFEAMLTIRYFPMCHLPESLRKYVTNARYVLSCEYEWDYGSCGLSKEDHWKRSLEIGGSVSINTEPCASCGLRMHCGGWNSVYAAGFDGAGLHAIPFDGIDQTPGWLHDQNPSRRISNGRGWF
jgi:MoaA/NifB/PqqE/SkfB family radical SAM enzyme